MGIMNFWVAVAALVTVGLVPMAADEDPLQDFCVADMASGLVSMNGFPCKPAAKVCAGDFKFDVLAKPGNTNNADMAVVTNAYVAQFPALNMLGVGAARVDYAQGGIKPPHTHPRATEVFLLLKGELYVGFVSTDGALNTLFATILKAGELFVFPRGLVHFQLNVGKGSALAFAAFNSPEPGRGDHRTGIVPARHRGRGLGEGVQDRRQDGGHDPGPIPRLSRGIPNDPVPLMQLEY